MTVEFSITHCARYTNNICAARDLKSDAGGAHLVCARTHAHAHTHACTCLRPALGKHKGHSLV